MNNTIAGELYSTEVKPEWLDYNEHMNVAYYLLVFDQAEEVLLERLGLGEAVTRETNISWMVLENHITYDNEVTRGQEVEVSVRLVDHDLKRLHLYLEMHTKGEDAYLASTLEQMVMCVDLNERKSTEFPPQVLPRIKIFSEQNSCLGRPENIGRTIGIRHK